MASWDNVDAVRKDLERFQGGLRVNDEIRAVHHLPPQVICDEDVEIEDIRRQFGAGNVSADQVTPDLDGITQMIKMVETCDDRNDFENDDKQNTNSYYGVVLSKPTVPKVSRGVSKKLKTVLNPNVKEFMPRTLQQAEMESYSNDNKTSVKPLEKCGDGSVKVVTENVIREKYGNTIINYNKNSNEVQSKASEIEKLSKKLNNKSDGSYQEKLDTNLALVRLMKLHSGPPLKLLTPQDFSPNLDQATDVQPSKTSVERVKCSSPFMFLPKGTGVNSKPDQTTNDHQPSKTSVERAKCSSFMILPKGTDVNSKPDQTTNDHQPSITSVEQVKCSPFMFLPKGTGVNPKPDQSTNDHQPSITSVEQVKCSPLKFSPKATGVYPKTDQTTNDHQPSKTSVEQVKCSPLVFPSKGTGVYPKVDQEQIEKSIDAPTAKDIADSVNKVESWMLKDKKQEKEKAVPIPKNNTPYLTGQFSYKKKVNTSSESVQSSSNSSKSNSTSRPFVPSSAANELLEKFQKHRLAKEKQEELKNSTIWTIAERQMKEKEEKMRLNKKGVST